MANFGTQQEANDGYVNKLYTGLANFRVTNVNPSHEELKKIYGENAKEPNYVGEGTKGEGESQVKYPQIRFDFYVETEPEEGEDPIKTKVTFFVGQTSRTTNDGKKVQCINAYGNTAWLTKEQLSQKLDVYKFEGSNGTYEFDATSMRIALNGEEQFITFLRNLLNLPSLKTALSEGKDPKEAMSFFTKEDWSKIIGGNISLVKSIVKSTNNKVGLLLGVKTVGDKMYQDVYTKQTFRQYFINSGKFDYLRKDLENAKSNGAYPSTDFGDKSFKLNEYVEGATPTDQDTLFNDSDVEEEDFDFDDASFETEDFSV